MPDLNSYTIGWISAISSEYVAAQVLLDERHDPPEWIHENDDNNYTLGKIGQHNVVLAVLPRGTTGVASAAIAARDMKLTFPKVRVGLMVGVGGGAPSSSHDIRLGDVVVSVPSYGPSGNTGGVLQYDFANTIKAQSFQSARYLNQPPRALTAAVHGLEAHHEIEGNSISATIASILKSKPKLRKSYGRPERDTDVLYESTYPHQQGSQQRNQLSCADVCGRIGSHVVTRPDREEDEDDPKIHYGLIASADSFMEDAKIRDLLAKDTGVLCFEMEAAGLLNTFPCLVIRGICDYSDSHWNGGWRGYAAMAAAAYAKELIGQIVPTRLEAEKDIGTLVHQIDERVDAIHHRVILESLPTADDAYFDSFEEGKAPTCLKDTRVDLLRLIADWAHGQDSPVIFWLNGRAGTGKSTICRTFAQSLDQTKHLGSSFFFKRGASDRNHAKRLFTTLAADLVAKKPAFLSYMKKVIEADPKIGTKGLREQFETLILRPWAAITPKSSEFGPVVFVIDALDECDSDDEIKQLIHIFSVAKGLGLRVFLTSRPELPLRIGFKSIQGRFKEVLLHNDIPEDIIRHDISCFLNHEISLLRTDYNSSLIEEERKLPETWPGQDNIQTLVTMAIPLFIFAATVCRFLSDQWCGQNPEMNLQQVLEFQTRSQGSQMDATYLPILMRPLQARSRKVVENFLERFRYIVGSIVVLANPLSVLALGKILGEPKEAIDALLDLFHSVLDVPSSPVKPVQLFHLSFRDYLLDPEKREEIETYPFWVDERKTHERLAVQCLQLLSTGNILREDLCNLRLPGISRSEIDQGVINDSLAPEVRYACQHWAFHWRKGRCLIKDGDVLHVFLSRHLLHWLEALSLLGRIPESLGMISDLLNMLQPEDSGNITAFLNDTQRILLGHRSTIDAFPLQIYSSAIIFAPRNSVVRNTLGKRLPNWLSLAPEVDSNWDACLATLEDHENEILCVAFSPDSKWLASGSADAAAKLWDTSTGACMATLTRPVLSRTVDTIAFSPDSSQIVSTCRATGNILLWGTSTGKCTKIIASDCREFHALATLPESKWLVLGSRTDNTLDVWDTETHSNTTLECGGRKLSWAAFSPDTKWLTFVFKGNNIELWETATYTHVATFAGHEDSVISAAFSPDSRQLVSASGDLTIKLWEIATCSCMATLKGHQGPVCSVAFSPDSKQIASASDDGTIKLWHSATGACKATFRSHQGLSGESGSTVPIAFSPDSRRLVSGHLDSKMKLWDTAATDHTAIVESRHFRHTPSLAVFSADSKVLASVSGYTPPALHNAENGAKTMPLECYGQWPESIAFSNDGQLATVLDGEPIKVNMWDPATGVCLQEHRVTRSKGFGVGLLVFSPDSTWLALGYDDEAVKLLDPKTGLFKTAIEARHGEDRGGGRAETIAFSPNSMWLALGRHDHTIEIWDTITSSSILTLTLADYIPTSVVFLDAAQLISICSDHTINLWNLATGDCTATVHFDRACRFVSFDAENFLLRTNMGTLTLDKVSPRRHPDMESLALVEYWPRRHPSPTPGLRIKSLGVGLSPDNQWVLWNKHKILWLPPTYRPQSDAWYSRHSSAVAGSTLAITTTEGRTLLMTIRPSEMRELFKGKG